MIADVLLVVLVAIVAIMYASVGHGGASGYLALMALVGFQQELLRPTALALNLFVSLIAFIHYHRAGHFRWKLFWPFALTSVPLAFIGAQVDLDPSLYKRVLGVLLLFAVARLMGLFGRQQGMLRSMPLVAALPIGAMLGLFSGMIGIGGGILLSPVILLLRWGDMKTTAAVSALFIFVNSAAGLIGLQQHEVLFEPYTWILIAGAVAGGTLGAWMGARRTGQRTLAQVLGVVLLLASIKLIFVP